MGLAAHSSTLFMVSLTQVAGLHDMNTGVACHCQALLIHSVEGASSDICVSETCECLTFFKASSSIVLTLCALRRLRDSLVLT